MTLGMDGTKGGLTVSSVIEPKDELEEVFVIFILFIHRNQV